MPQMFVPAENNLTGGSGGEAQEEESQEIAAESKEESSEEKQEEVKEEKEEEKSDVKFGDFFKAQGTERDNLEEESKQKSVEKKEEKPKEEVEKKEEVKVEEKPSRDFSGLPDEVIPLFKKMGNESFAKLKPIFIEHSQLKDVVKQKDAKIAELQKGVPVLPDHYFEHPQGYLLDPTFAQEEANTDLANKIVQHWSLQLARIRRGEQWQDLIEDKNGKISMDKPQAATAEAEAQVGGYLTACQQQLMEQNRKLADITKNFAEKHKTDLELLKQGEAQYFPDFDKPEHPTAAIQKEVLKALPPSFRSSPLASVLAKTAAANAMLRAEIESLKKSVPAANNKPVKKQPTKSQAFGSGAESKSTVKFSDFQDLLS